MFDFTNIPDILYFYVLPIALIIGYYLYLKKFQFYQVSQQFEPNDLSQKVPRGKCPPAYPNGWFIICRSNQLKVKQVSEIKVNGRHIAYFRGEDNKVYALNAYCLHMGANLGFGGKVKHGHCIECPFHGWTFDGKTGKCVNSEVHDPKKVNHMSYCDIDRLTKDQKGEYIVNNGEGEAQLDKYHTREMNGFVYVWLHCKEKEPTYEPIEIHYRNMSLRAESVNYVHCHIQEIPENGADMRHFDYLHYSVAEFLNPIIQLNWQMKSHRPTEPDFYEKMKHPRQKMRAEQDKLFKDWLSDKERIKYFNIINLDCYILLFQRWKFYAFTVTGFQTGPATVTLVLISAIFRAVFQQAIQPLDKYYQKVIHTLYISSWVPYWFSAYVLFGEFQQVCNDGKIWKHKIFSDKLCYNLKTIQDSTLLSWRNWYSQFFDGSKEFEQKQGELDW